VQRAPESALAIKREVDRSCAPGRFLLTSSANFLMMRRVPWRFRFTQALSAGRR
jgi:hypothetical protein